MIKPYNIFLLFLIFPLIAYAHNLNFKRFQEKILKKNALELKKIIIKIESTKLKYPSENFLKKRLIEDIKLELFLIQLFLPLDTKFKISSKNKPSTKKEQETKNWKSLNVDILNSFIKLYKEIILELKTFKKKQKINNNKYTDNIDFWFKYYKWQKDTKLKKLNHIRNIKMQITEKEKKKWQDLLYKVEICKRVAQNTIECKKLNWDKQLDEFSQMFQNSLLRLHQKEKNKEKTDNTIYIIESLKKTIIERIKDFEDFYNQNIGNFDEAYKQEEKRLF